MAANVAFSSTHVMKNLCSNYSLETNTDKSGTEIIVFLSAGNQFRGVVVSAEGDVLILKSVALLDFTERAFGTYFIAWSEIAAIAAPNAPEKKQAFAPMDTRVKITGASTHIGEGHAGSRGGGSLATSTHPSNTGSRGAGDGSENKGLINVTPVPTVDIEPATVYPEDHLTVFPKDEYFF